MWSEEDLLSTDSYSHSYDHDRHSRPDRDRRRSAPEPMPELYSIHRGQVVSIKEFGAFVRLDGFRTQGLLHRSHISKEPISSIENVISRDEMLWVKVVNVDDDPERPRFGLSMRLVAQRDGSDLDPNNVELMLAEQKRKSFHDHERKVVQLDAVLPTTCTKCGAEGHLDWECYASQNKGKSYELIDDRSFDQLMTRVDSHKHSSRSRDEPAEKKKKSKSSSRSKDRVLDVSEISSREQALEILQEIERKKQRKKEKKRLKRERESSRHDDRERKRHKSDRDHSRERRHRSSSSSEKRRRH